MPQMREVFVQGGSFFDPIIITHISSGRHVPYPMSTAYSGTVAPMVPHVSILPPVRGKGEADYGQFFLDFKRYDREAEKAFNRMFPEFYAPKSWFSKALKDKLGTNEARTLDRLKHLRDLGRMSQEQYETQVAALKASTQHAAQIRAWEQEAVKTLKAWERKERAELLKAWEGNNGPAMPQGGKYLKPHDSLRHHPYLISMPGPHPQTPKDFYVEKVTHGSVTNGMEGRQGRGCGGGFHNGNPMSRREEKALDLAQEGIELNRFLERVKDAEREGIDLAGKPGGRKANKRALSMRHAYELKRAEYDEKVLEFKSGGIMGRLKGFENSVGRSSRGKAASEKIKQEGRKDYR